MKYEKPKLNVLGPALGAIHSNCGEKGSGNVDSLGCPINQHNTAAAYEADE